MDVSWVLPTNVAVVVTFQLKYNLTFTTAEWFSPSVNSLMSGEQIRLLEDLEALGALVTPDLTAGIDLTGMVLHVRL